MDTPGFDDTYLSDSDVLHMIGYWMKDAYDEKITLTGILYLHRISEIRMGGTQMKNIRLLSNLCGTKSLSNVLLTTTRWDLVDIKTGLHREAQLVIEEDSWKD